MRKIVQITISTFAVLFVVSSTGCKTLQYKQEGSLESSAVLASESYFYLMNQEESEEQLQAFVEKYPDHQLAEKDKIDYLLQAVKKSKLTFVRNGESYSSAKAAKWLRWKMHHPQYNSDPIDSAEDFVFRVADGSKTSGLPYQLILPSGRYVKTIDILSHELQMLENNLSKYTTTEFSPNPAS